MMKNLKQEITNKRIFVSITIIKRFPYITNYCNCINRFFYYINSANFSKLFNHQIIQKTLFYNV